MQEKVCRSIFEKSPDKWKSQNCGLHCNRTNQLKCEFLAERIREEANNPDRERDIVDTSAFAVPVRG